jgi:HEAT repeat protein
MLTRLLLIPPGVLFALLVSLAPSVLAAADDDEPTFLDKPLSYWLKELQDGKTIKARHRGALAVEKIGQSRSKKVIPALVKAMKSDKEAKLRAVAARAVGRAIARAFEIAREDGKELPRLDDARDALASALKTDKDDSVREAAAQALGDIGADARAAVESLASALKDKHDPTVRAAASALRKMGKAAVKARADLLVLVGNKKADTNARTEAARSLGFVTTDASEVLPVLKEVVGDTKSDNGLRKVVAETIGKLGKDAAGASAILGAILIEKDAPADLRLAAAGALDEFGSTGKAGIPNLIKATADADRFVRCKSLHALGRMGAELDTNRKGAVRAILKATEDTNQEVAVAALDCLGTLSSEGLGAEVENVIKRLDSIIAREGRKTIVEAAENAKTKVRPKKPKD